MKKAALTLAAIAVSSLVVRAETTVFSANFGGGYTNGNLVGQYNWSQTSTASNNPIQVNSGVVVLPTGLGGQDVWAPFGTVVTNTAGNYMLSTVNFSVTNATEFGDYFFNLSTPTNTPSAFFQRLWARTNTGGELNFGITVAATNASTSVNWGSTAFSFNTSYSAVMKWNFVSGLSNDVVSLFIDPVGSIDTWTPEASVTWNSATAEPGNLQAVNLRQGGAVSVPGVLVDSIDVSVVPEPGTYALLALSAAGLAAHAARRRRR